MIMLLANNSSGRGSCGADPTHWVDGDGAAVGPLGQCGPYQRGIRSSPRSNRGDLHARVLLRCPGTSEVPDAREAPAIAGSVSHPGTTAGSGSSEVDITKPSRSRQLSNFSIRGLAKRSWTSAGQGVLARHIAERGARYTGVDASPRLI